MTRRLTLTVLGLVLLAGATAGLAAFQPWKAWTVRTVSEPLPAVAAPVPSAGSSGAASAASSGAPSAGSSGAASAGSSSGAASASGNGTPVTVAGGQFRSLAHDTSGTARVLRLPDGGQALRIEGLSTSDGPDVRVWLSAQPADRATDAGDATWLELGRLRGNRGDLTYPIPAGTDVRDFGSVVIWCKRFSVAFGAAPLTPA